MKKKAIKIFWICAAAVLFVAGIRFLTKLMDPGYAYSKNKEFMENSETYDVLFFGNSHMANAVYPMELWHDHGIAAYNLAGFGNSIPATYWMMENVLDDAGPELVVLDCNCLSMDEKVARKGMLHAQIDCLPLNGNKLRMICDLMEDPRDRMEFIWDFTLYHDRWWDLDQADFEKEINIQKGAEIAIDVAQPWEMAGKPEDTVVFDSTGEAYLRRAIEECQSRDMDILLTYLPFPAAEQDWQEALYAEQLAKSYDVPYINFLDLSVVDLEVDCSDPNSHLNGSGGRKVTDYLGAYIDRHYEIADHRGEEAYSGWQEDYRRYTDYKISVMESLEALDKYLMMLTDPAFDCCVYINGAADVWRADEMFAPLLENMSGNEAGRLQEAGASGEDYFLVLDHQTGQIFESVGEENLQVECSFGRVCYENGENGERKLFIREGEENYLQMTPGGGEAAVQIVVIDRETGNIVDVKRYDNELAVYME